MSFEHLNAPATKMVNTPCVCCSTLLVDAESLARQIGPHCWKKYMKREDKLLSAESRKEANQLIYRIAADRENPEVVLPGCKRLEELGLPTIAKHIIKRIATVVIEEEGDVLRVRTPYSEQVVIHMRSISGRRWNAEKKVNEFPLKAKPALWQMLVNLFPGAVGVGPKGPIVVTYGGPATQKSLAKAG